MKRSEMIKIIQDAVYDGVMDLIIDEEEAGYILSQIEKAGMLPPAKQEPCFCSMRSTCRSCSPNLYKTDKPTLGVYKSSKGKVFSKSEEIQMKRLIILVGPAGSGKSTLAKEFEAQGYVRISQDEQGKEGHLKAFKDALNQELSIVIDRMNFSREQRKRYIPPSESGYIIECIVLHENRKTCLERMKLREHHPTINNMQQAGSALNTFFKGYERPSLVEGFDSIDFRYPETGRKTSCIVTDIDGTIANLDHRLHYIKPIDGSKKNFRKFLDACDKDLPKEDVIDMVINTYIGYGEHSNLVACSGRGDECREKTQAWLDEHLPLVSGLFMRERGDYRDDSLVKENLLDFEILTRYHKVYCVFDDRDRVVKMWRNRGILCLQVAEGDF